MQENYGYSVGSRKRVSDQIRNSGEGTNLGIRTLRGLGCLRLLENRMEEEHMRFLGNGNYLEEYCQSLFLMA